MKIFYVGNQGDPADRTQIEVSDLNAAIINSEARRGEHFTATVFDNISRKRVTVADESCGLDCRCALRFVDKP